MPLNVTLLAVATSWLLYVPTGVPVMLTVSLVYGLPSDEVPVPAVSEPARLAVPLTTADVVAL